MPYPIRPTNLDLVAAELAGAMAEVQPPPERPGSNRMNETLHLFHHVRDALIQSELDRGHTLPGEAGPLDKAEVTRRGGF